MPDCTYSLNRFFIQEFSQPYAAFLLRSSRHSLIANRLQCSQLVERCTLHAAFFAASNEFISFPLHSFARHQHTHMQTHPDTYRERESEGERWRKSGTDTTADRETLLCGHKSWPGRAPFRHCNIVHTNSNFSLQWWWHCQNAKSTQRRERSSKYEYECESESVTELRAGCPVLRVPGAWSSPVRSGISVCRSVSLRVVS